MKTLNLRNTIVCDNKKETLAWKLGTVLYWIYLTYTPVHNVPPHTIASVFSLNCFMQKIESRFSPVS